MGKHCFAPPKKICLLCLFFLKMWRWRWSWSVRRKLYSKMRFNLWPKFTNTNPTPLFIRNMFKSTIIIENLTNNFLNPNQLFICNMFMSTIIIENPTNNFSNPNPLFIYFQHVYVNNNHRKSHKQFFLTQTHYLFISTCLCPQTIFSNPNPLFVYLFSTCSSQQ